MDTDISSFWEVLIWSFWVFLWVSALVIVFHCVVDLLGDAALSGWAKACWAVVLVSIPWFGALSYVVARRRGTVDRPGTSSNPDGIPSGASDSAEAAEARR